MTNTFNTFISYNSQDKPAVRELVNILKYRNISVWFDEEQLQPGVSWLKSMEEGIYKSKSGIVLVGRNGIGPWENEEMEALLQMAVSNKIPLIPVLLPNGTISSKEPLFMRSRTWVEFQYGYTKEGIDKLIWGISGKKKKIGSSNICEYISKRGHQIHKLKAKDSTGRWAYYFTLVEPDIEHAFLKALKSDENIDLEHYGKVIASCYGEEPDENTKNFLKSKYNFDV